MLYECGGNVRGTFLSECEKMEKSIFWTPFVGFIFGGFWGILETAHPLTLTWFAISGHGEIYFGSYVVRSARTSVGTPHNPPNVRGGLPHGTTGWGGGCFFRGEKLVLMIPTLPNGL